MLREKGVATQGPRYQHQRAAVQGHTHYCMTSLNFWVNSETEYSGGLRKACPVVRHDTGPLHGLRQRPQQPRLAFKHFAFSTFGRFCFLWWTRWLRFMTLHEPCLQYPARHLSATASGRTSLQIVWIFFFFPFCVMLIWSAVKGKGEYGVQTKGVWIN